MFDNILKAKHWQLFIIGVGLPMIFYVVWMYNFFTRIIAIENIPNPEEVMPQMIFGDMKYIFIFAIIMSALMMLWQWSIAIGLQEKIPSALRLNLGTFKILIFIPMIFSIGYMFWMQSFINQIMLMPNEMENMEQYQQSMGIMTLAFPLSLLVMFCSLYVMFICAKTIKTAENQSKVTLGEIVGEIVLVWFFPIGIWILQPRINALMNKEQDAEIIGTLID